MYSCHPPASPPGPASPENKSAFNARVRILMESVVFSPAMGCGARRGFRSVVAETVEAVEGAVCVGEGWWSLESWLAL